MIWNLIKYAEEVDKKKGRTEKLSNPIYHFLGDNKGRVGGWSQNPSPEMALILNHFYKENVEMWNTQN